MTPTQTIPFNHTMTQELTTPRPVLIDSHLLKHVRLYDNGGKTLDRYTAVFLNEPERARNTFAAYGMSEHPFHGIGQSCTAMLGRHLGRRITFDQLPRDCQILVRDYLDPM